MLHLLELSGWSLRLGGFIIILVIIIILLNTMVWMHPPAQKVPAVAARSWEGVTEIPELFLLPFTTGTVAAWALSTGLWLCSPLLGSSFLSCHPSVREGSFLLLLPGSVFSPHLSVFAILNLLFCGAAASHTLPPPRFSCLCNPGRAWRRAPRAHTSLPSSPVSVSSAQLLCWVYFWL